jgi:hypothetical protein
MPTIDEVQALIAGADGLGEADRRLAAAHPELGQVDRWSLLRAAQAQRRAAFYAPPPAKPKKKAVGK